MEHPYDAAFDTPQELEHPDVVEEVDDDLSDDEQALLYNGYLKGEVKIGERTIRIRTLKIGEELDASLLAAPWKDTADASRALVTAYVAASITSVDGKPLVTPLGPNDNEMEMKFQYVLDNWYWLPTINYVYSEYNKLLGRINEASQKVNLG